MKKIKTIDISRKNKLRKVKVILTMYNGGYSQNADISTYSLHPFKSVTTGEGGIFSTNSKL